MNDSQVYCGEGNDDLSAFERSVEIQQNLCGILMDMLGQLEHKLKPVTVARPQKNTVEKGEISEVSQPRSNVIAFLEDQNAFLQGAINRIQAIKDAIDL